MDKYDVTPTYGVEMFATEMAAIKSAEVQLAKALFDRYPVGSDVQWKVQRWIHVGEVERHVDRSGDPRLFVRNRQTGNTRMLRPDQIVSQSS